MPDGLIEKLHLQHAELLQILTEVREISAGADFSDSAISAICEKLRIFSKLLVEHIHLENTVLYPGIFENLRNDKASAQSAHIVLGEMKDIQDVAIVFLNKYNRAEKNSRAFRDFNDELKDIIFVLDTRIKIEEENVFQYWKD